MRLNQSRSHKYICYLTLSTVMHVASPRLVNVLLRAAADIYLAFILASHFETSKPTYLLHNRVKKTMLRFVYLLFLLLSVGQCNGISLTGHKAKEGKFII